MALLDELLTWAERLTQLEPDRCRDAFAELRTWRLDHVESELLHRPDLDTIVAATLLVESVRALTAQGVAETKLLKKLRDARDPAQFWPVWAELRTAGVLIGHPDIDVQLELEPTRSSGRHADYRLRYPDGSSIAVEFKAIGLSDSELDWHQRAAKQFNKLCPPFGLTTLHGYVDQEIRVDAAKRKQAWAGARRLAMDLPEVAAAWRPLRGIAIVGHQTESTYLQRTRSRLARALKQFDGQEECWVAIWWSNGAPSRSAQSLLDEIGAPSNVAGVSYVGQAVAVPWSQISVYILNVDREADLSQRHVESTVSDELATLVLDRFDSSSGNRPTLLKTPGPSGITLVRRDGRRRLNPFNLLFDADPREFADDIRPPSPVQDVRLNR